MDSILTSIKKLLGIMEDYTEFDVDIIIYINSALSILNQLGVGPAEGFTIRDKTATWDQYISDRSKIEFVKTYVYMKVRLIFDPPGSSALVTAMQEQVKELEFRLNVAADTTE